MLVLCVLWVVILGVLWAVVKSFLIVALSLIVLAGLWIAIAPVRARIVEAKSGSLSGTTSLGEIIRNSPDRPVHILFVHGIRNGDRGSSAAFRAGLCARLNVDAVDRKTHHLDMGTNPGVTFMGQPVWPDDAWEKRGPFVDRYEYRPHGRKESVFLDEVNWWPLALPLRLQALMIPEAGLAGPDKADLRFCALDDDVHYPFLTEKELADLIAAKPRGGGADWINGDLKRSLLDWGLSDSTIALGPMKFWLRKAIDKAFEYADGAHAVGAQTQFVVVAESLGSFIVFDAYAADKPATQRVLDKTACLYFFANQISLHELGRLRVTTPEPEEAALLSAAPHHSIHQALTAWAAKPPHPSLTGAARQIIAFSDPSDALTFVVPEIPGVKVANLYDRNGLDLPYLVANPVVAHIGHSTNRGVLDVMFR